MRAKLVSTLKYVAIAGKILEIISDTARTVMSLLDE